MFILFFNLVARLRNTSDTFVLFKADVSINGIRSLSVNSVIKSCLIAPGKSDFAPTKTFSNSFGQYKSTSVFHLSIFFNVSALDKSNTKTTPFVFR